MPKPSRATVGSFEQETPHNRIEGLRCRVRFPVFGRECNETVELTVPGSLFEHASPPARALLRRIFKVAL